VGLGCDRRLPAVDFRVPRFFNYKTGRFKSSAEALLTQVYHGSTTPNKTSQISIDRPLPEMWKGRPSTSSLQNVQQEARIANRVS
jgi:hypothetical protein